MTKVALLMILLTGCAGQPVDPQSAVDAALDLRELVARACKQPPVVDQEVCDKAQAAWNTVFAPGQQ